MILFIILLKFIIPSLMLKFPFAGVWANYFLDIVDGDILRSLGLSEGAYQFTDKFADYFFYFQNFLEPLLLIYTYLIFKNKNEKKAFSIYKKHLVLIWGIILVYKV